MANIVVVEYTNCRTVFHYLCKLYTKLQPSISSFIMGVVLVPRKEKQIGIVKFEIINRLFSSIEFFIYWRITI